MRGPLQLWFGRIVMWVLGFRLDNARMSFGRR